MSEPQLIVYICYFIRGGLGLPYIQFMELMPLLRGAREVMFECILELVIIIELDLQKLMAIATYGATCMTEAHQGIIA